MAAFFVRLWREKSLGAGSAIIILIVIFVALFVSWSRKNGLHDRCIPGHEEGQREWR